MSSIVNHAINFKSSCNYLVLFSLPASGDKMLAVAGSQVQQANK